MDVQKTIIRVLELFRMLAILYGITLVIFVASAFYYFKQDKPPQQNSTATLVNSSETKSVQFSETALKGKSLFTESCAQCHATTDEVVVGPGLKGIQERRQVKWLRDWIRNSPKVIASGDKYAVELFNKYNKTAMTTFTNYTDEDIDSILKYIAEANGEVAVP